MTRFGAAIVGLFAMLAASVYFSPSLSARAVATQDGGVTLPVIIKEVHPKGDKHAKVDFECVVEEDGSVSTVKITKSSDEKLNEAATDAMKQWLFKPATRNGKPVRITISVELSFKP